MHMLFVVCFFSFSFLASAALLRNVGPNKIYVKGTNFDNAAYIPGNTLYVFNFYSSPFICYMLSTDLTYSTTNLPLESVSASNFCKHSWGMFAEPVPRALLSTQIRTLRWNSKLLDGNSFAYCPDVFFCVSEDLHWAYDMYQCNFIVNVFRAQALKVVKDAGFDGPEKVVRFDGQAEIIAFYKDHFVLSLTIDSSWNLHTNLGEERMFVPTVDQLFHVDACPPSSSSSDVVFDEI